MKPPGLLLAAVLGLATSPSSLAAQTIQPAEPVEISKLPFIEIFSPTFFWSDAADFVRVGATTCPKGRAVAGGVSIRKGRASLRILESYPDGESWVMRVVNRQQPANVQSLQIRGFGLCMLPAARKVSVMITQYSRVLHLSQPFPLQPGWKSSAARQGCPQNALPISGGFGLDPAQHGPAVPRLELSYPDPTGWNVRAVNGAAPSGPPAEGRVHAVCLGNDGGVSIREYRTVYFVTTDVTVRHGNEVVRQSVGCGEQEAYALAGGARTLRGRSATIEIEESFPDTPTSWTIGLVNRGGRRDGDATVRLYAVCIKR